MRWPTEGHRAIGEAAAEAVISKVFPEHRGALNTVRGVIAKVMRQLVELEAWEAQLAEAWDEGWTYAFEDHGPKTHNPYRKAE